MQDGAPPRWELRVREWLDEKVSTRWIGRGGPRDSNMSLPPRSPIDFLSLEFCHGNSLRKKLREFG